QKSLPRHSADDLRRSLQLQGAESVHMGQVLPEEALYRGQTQRKELIFDIDCTEYRRFCECEGHKRVCSFCWLHIEGTVLILRHFLCQRLGIPEQQLL